MDYLGIITTACGGFGLFIYGMYVLADGLRKMAGDKMKRLLEALTRNKFLGVLLGAGVTAIIQSSSATTVMVVGFVNAGLMELSQAVGVIMGANVGTTATSWIVSSVEWAAALKPDNIAPLAMAVGASLVLFTKTGKLRESGAIVAGFGMLFLGMGMMSSGLRPLASSQAFVEAFLSFGHNPLLGILAGLGVTAIVQSSSASVGILQSLAINGMVPWNAAVYIIMGQNIGTCVTALLSAVGAKRNARAAAYVHLLFNVIGSVVFAAAAVIYFKFFNKAFGFSMITSTEISVVHTVFNVATTVLLFGFSNGLVALARRMANVAGEGDKPTIATFLDPRMLNNPHAALENSRKEISRLGHMALENLACAKAAVLSMDAEKVDAVVKREKDIDKLTDAISHYMVKILSSPAGLSERENEWVSTYFHTLQDIERVGDHAENLSELAENLISVKTAFSEAAKAEIAEMMENSARCFELAIYAFETGDRDSAQKARDLEDVADKLESRFRDSHIRRLGDGTCLVSGDISFVNALTDLERVADHANNIAKVVLGLPKHSKKR
jgi:phosphate:Na+ symporter